MQSREFEFESVDKNGDGHLDHFELTDFLNSIGNDDADDDEEDDDDDDDDDDEDEATIQQTMLDMAKKILKDRGSF